MFVVCLLACLVVCLFVCCFVCLFVCFVVTKVGSVRPSFRQDVQERHGKSWENHTGCEGSGRIPGKG